MGRIWGFEGGSGNCPLASGTCNDKTEEFSTQLKNLKFCRDKSHARSFFSVDSVVENQRARCIKKGGVFTWV